MPSFAASFGSDMREWGLPMLVFPLVLGREFSASGLLGLLISTFVIVLWAGVIALFLILLKPLLLRASLTQDFAASFDFAFVKQFIQLTWADILYSSIFLVIASVVLMLLGTLVFCIGMYFSMVITYFCAAHMDKQLYHLHLSRGGMAVAISAKLTGGTPPVLPVSV